MGQGHELDNPQVILELIKEDLFNNTTKTDLTANTARSRNPSSVCLFTTFTYSSIWEKSPSNWIKLNNTIFIKFMPIKWLTNAPSTLGGNDSQFCAWSAIGLGQQPALFGDVAEFVPVAQGLNKTFITFWVLQYNFSNKMAHTRLKSVQHRKGYCSSTFSF